MAHHGGGSFGAIIGVDHSGGAGHRVWATLTLALKGFARIGGAESAAAFAHYAFFALFPLILLFVSIASVFVDRDRAGAASIAYVETLVPIGGEKQQYIFDTIGGVVEARGQAGVLSFLMLVWAAKGFFGTLLHATNRAWGEESHTWWRLPLKSLSFLAITLCATVLLVAAEGLFVIYLTHFATLNAVYGIFGGIMALLLWIDLSGCIVIFGACLCAARAEWLSGAGGADPAPAGSMLWRRS